MRSDDKSLMVDLSNPFELPKISSHQDPALTDLVLVYHAVQKTVTKSKTVDIPEGTSFFSFPLYGIVRLASRK